MIITVLFCIFLKIKSCITFSLNESRFEVASSNMYISESVNKALAIASLCFSPPDKFQPFSSTNDKYLF